MPLCFRRCLPKTLDAFIDTGRRRKDSNLRKDFSLNILAGCCLKPLGHASAMYPMQGAPVQSYTSNPPSHVSNQKHYSRKNRRNSTFCAILSPCPVVKIRPAHRAKSEKPFDESERKIRRKNLLQSNFNHLSRISPTGYAYVHLHRGETKRRY
ncbi:MAG: hypothetical protein UY60_C0011G0012 [Parcubacteria group bacterium GW2011_GWB1_50_9]|uniref:Uncharacterized protein n=1 Tax=Candidatus Adlerbacteria bacterium GW2011_GWC1_50_9 TaxID=1618608 RepID=A0A0G1ZN14_9BACT|nr:MAG: hypothetical protein UY60_C0011G0012 [Parcubacteria group bacterium GW2011_GWB1_50_9]KKW20814.1 MAG: hypothetical protein UY61_C0022G0011 [Candidatus Adlerbacteria bacterium GW2011_GWC1_50_9]